MGRQPYFLNGVGVHHDVQLVPDGVEEDGEGRGLNLLAQFAHRLQHPPTDGAIVTPTGLGAQCGKRLQLGNAHSVKQVQVVLVNGSVAGDAPRNGQEIFGLFTKLLWQNTVQILQLQII